MGLVLEPGRQILYLSASEVSSVGPSMAETIAAVKSAFVEHGCGVAQLPPKTAIHPLNEDAFIHAMPGFVSGAAAAGVKWVSGYPRNAELGLPYITGLLILNDPGTGIPMAVMDCTWITAQRTGAVSGIAAAALARPGASTVALLGAGVQGRTQVSGLAEAVPRLSEVRVYDVSPHAVDRFCAEMQARLPRLRMIGSMSAEEAVSSADIVVSAGPIVKRPNRLIQRSWFKEGCLGLPIDFDCMWTAEALGLSDRYFVDDVAQYRYYEGEGFFGGAPRVDGALGGILTGDVAGREHSRQRIVSMNLGVAIADMVTARLVYDRALNECVGRKLSL